MSGKNDLPPAEEDYPFQRLLGYEVTAWSENFARVELPLADRLMNRQGLPHGGVHATLMDTAMGYAGCYTGNPDRRKLALTLSLTVNYLGQATGDRMIAEARVTGGGRRTYFAEASLVDGTGAMIATASGVFRYRG